MPWYIALTVGKDFQKVQTSVQVVAKQSMIVMSVVIILKEK